MARFQQEKQPKTGLKYLCSACIFICMIVIFYEGIHSVSADTRRRQRESLEDALNRDITSCYALEGTYPESLDYLKDNYGLTYDEDYFYVDYQVLGSNLFPDVTIIEKGDR